MLRSLGLFYHTAEEMIKYGIKEKYIGGRPKLSPTAAAGGLNHIYVKLFNLEAPRFLKENSVLLNFEAPRFLKENSVLLYLEARDFP